MSPTHPKGGSQFQSMPGMTSRVHTEKSKQDVLLENYREQALLVEKYKQQLAVVDNLKKRVMLQKLDNERNGSNELSTDALSNIPFNAQTILEHLEMMSLGKVEANNNEQDSFIPCRKDSVPFSEQVKQTSMQDTLHRRTLAVQESIRQTLAASGGGVDANNNSMPSLEQHLPRNIDDLNIVDMLADPRWSSMKQYRGMDDRHEGSRRENGTNLALKILLNPNDFILYI